MTTTIILATSAYWMPVTDVRRQSGAAMNIVPTSTGAAKAVALDGART